jgi:hypothetical protein
MTNDRFDAFIETALKRHAEAPPVDQAAVVRVLRRLAPPLPRQKLALWRWPAVLLDWQFAPSWPRVAALAACAVFGFYVGIAGLDRPFDKLDASFTVASRASANADTGALVFEPGPMIGAQP